MTKTKTTVTQNLVLASMCVALSVIMPSVFHLAGPQGGKMFLPLFWGVAVAAFLVPPKYVVLVSVLAPIISHFVLFQQKNKACHCCGFGVGGFSCSLSPLCAGGCLCVPSACTVYRFCSIGKQHCSFFAGNCAANGCSAHYLPYISEGVKP